MRTRQKRQRRGPATRTASVTNASSHLTHAALQARIAELQVELQARDDFLAIAAHELRNPMTPISARLELLRKKARNTPEGVPPAIAHGLEQLERLVDAYLRRATVLLDVSRIASGNLRLRSAPVDLSAMTRQVTANMTSLAERAGSPIELAVRDGIIARCDEMAMEQVLENLLSNAIRYGLERPIEVALTSDGQIARLSVRDEGIGISDSDQQHIFERFRALRRTGPSGGFGIGLWVAHQLVRRMDGEITVASRPGAGSTFTVGLPLHTNAEDKNGP